MDSNKNRLRVTLGSLAAIALLLGAFVVIWLVPRGPDTGNADVQKPTGQTTTTKNAPASNGTFAQTGAPAMASIQEQPHISVHGTGSISAKPDIANLQIGVQIQRDTLEAAQAEAATKMDAAMKELKAANIEDKDISTSQFNVEPVMNYPNNNQQPVVTGFRVTNILNVKLRDISKAGKVIDSLVKSGSNTIYGLSFGFSDPTALMKQAREQAMTDAKAKADQLATLGGVALGAPIMIEDGGSNTPPPTMEKLMASDAAGSVPQTSISPGQQEIRVDVNVLYGIK